MTAHGLDAGVMVSVVTVVLFLAVLINQFLFFLYFCLLLSRQQQKFRHCGWGGLAATATGETTAEIAGTSNGRKR